MSCEELNQPTTSTQAKLATRGRKRGRITDLPPCVICGEKASGLHYGVNSCEACKAFFYRNAKRAEVLACDSREDCQPKPGFGFACPACRMKQCLDSGMSLTDIKKGRYTYERRAHLKKSLGSKKSNNKDESAQDINKSDILQAATNSTNDFLRSAWNSENSNLSQCSSSSGVCGDTVDAFSVGSTSSPGSVCSENAPVVQRNQDVPLLTLEEMEDIIRKLRDLYVRHPQYPPEYFEKVHEVQRHFLETQQEKSKIFGQLEPLSREDFLSIYISTGMDIDGRIGYLKAFCPALEYCCIKYIQYAQELPGFGQLGKDDQVSTLKGAKGSFWTLSDFPTMDTKNGLLTSQNFVTLTRSEMATFVSEQYADGCFKLAEQLQNYNLTSDELDVLRALVLFNPDLCVTYEGKRHAAKQNAILQQVIQYLIEKNHPDDPNLLKELSDVQKKMLEWDQEETTQWRIVWSLVHHIVSEEEKKSLLSPTMEALYDIKKSNDNKA